MLTRRFPALFPIAGLAAVTILADQLSKWWVVERLFKTGETTNFLPWLFTAGARDSFTSVPVTPFFNLVMVWNRGISFGLFQNQERIMPYVLSALGLCVAGGFLLWARDTSSRLMKLATGLIVGGAIGNIWDRLRFGAVIDFLDVRLTDTYHWPAFNVADAAITLGVVLLLCHLLLDKPSPSARASHPV